MKSYKANPLMAFASLLYYSFWVMRFLDITIYGNFIYCVILKLNIRKEICTSIAYYT